MPIYIRLPSALTAFVLQWAAIAINRHLVCAYIDLDSAHDMILNMVAYLSLSLSLSISLVIYEVKINGPAINLPLHKRWNFWDT